MNISEGRLKKQIKAKKHLFLIQCASDFKSILASELDELKLEYRVSDAGFYSEMKLVDMYRLSVHLRTASRILLVLSVGRTGSNEDLFSSLSKIEWSLYIKDKYPISVKSLVRNSRLRHEGAAKDILQKVLHNAGYIVDSNGEQLIQIVIDKNKAELRINASGNHLHKRGYRLAHGPALIRETTAAALLKWALAYCNFASSIRILDPMCGSGTMLFEAVGLFNPLHIRGTRSYNFQHWPCYLDKSFQHLLKKSEHAAIEVCCLGYDTDTKVIEKAESIAKNIQDSYAGFKFDFENRNIFIDSKYPDSDLVVLNPPYGRRLNIDDKAYYKRLFHSIIQKCKAKAYLFLIPEEFIQQLPDYEYSYSFSNGGIHMKALLFLRK